MLEGVKRGGRTKKYTKTLFGMHKKKKITHKKYALECNSNILSMDVICAKTGLN